MLAIITLVVILLLGLLLIVGEVLFVPGTTFVGLLGVLLSGFGVYLTFTTFGASVGWGVLLVNAVVLLIAIAYGLKGNVWSKLALNSSINSRFNSEVIITLEVGDIGKTLSDLRPIGKAEIRDQIVEVKTNGSFINAGEQIKVTKISGNNIVVELLIKS